MSTRETLRIGSARLRVRPWHVDSHIAYVSLDSSAGRPTASGLSRCVRDLGERGYVSAITAALHPSEAAPFLQTGFEEYDRLRVLCRDLDASPERDVAGGLAVRCRRATSRDREPALALDARAFPTFWRLDADGLDEALDATAARRFRVAELDGDVVGYAVTGRAGRQGFLQRLATEPDLQRRGIATSLVLDALRWARRRRVRRMLVNTQRDNERAIALYRGLGFQMTTTDLVVLSRGLP